MPDRLFINSLKNKLITPIALATCLASISFLLLSILFSRSALAYEPRFFLWGLAGSKGLARIDWLLPVYSEPCSCLVYTDIQGEMDTETNWYGGIGIGHRTRIADRLYGGYAYVDRNYSSWHNAYYILSPGAETLGERWDARINGYIPVSKKKFSQTGEPLLRDTCGNNFNCDDTFFTGHQQFLKLYKKVEEVGTGLDMELGFHLGSHRNIDFYGGAYYFHFPENEDIKGLETRLVVPVRSSVALTVEVSYDNEHHGSIMGGVRLQSGHLSHMPVVLEDHFYDPISRNLATIHNGLGAPVARRHKFDRNLLVRDNIFFFKGEGGSAFRGETTGTFENPLAADQFTQTTVDDINLIVPNANLFFNSGTYIIEPTSLVAPNASIVLPGGQSIFGRSADYRCSAIGDERPVLLGELLLTEGNNHLDSIILSNSIVDPIITEDFTLTALTILDAPNVSICNSVINADLTFTGALDNNVFVTGIRLDNSIVDIDSSLINAQISPIGTNEQTAAALGIGGINGDVSTSIVRINDSIIRASSIIAGGGATDSQNYAVGIGTIAAGSTPTANFTSNNFVLSNTTVVSQAGVGALTSNLNSISAGIGSIVFGADETASANFEFNQFTITDSEIRSSASGNDNIILATGIGGNVIEGSAEFASNGFTITDSAIISSVTATTGTPTLILFSAGIGGNSLGSLGVGFTDNTFNVTNTEIVSSANSGSSNPASVGVTGIGSNSIIDLDTTRFERNIFSIVQSSIFSSSSTGVETISFITAIGGNAFSDGVISGEAEFINNLFTINSSQLSSIGFKPVGSNSLNYVTVVGGNAQGTGNADMTHMVMTIDSSTLHSEATVEGNNQGSNFVTGIGGNSETGVNAEILNSTFIVTNSNLDVLAHITGSNNASMNRAVGLIADTGTTINFTSSIGLVRAIIDGVNTGTNTALPFIQNGGTVIGAGSIQAQTLP